MSSGISEKYKYVNSLVELKEERLKNCEQALSAAKILYEDYKGAAKQDARVIESLINYTDMQYILPDVYVYSLPQPLSSYTN